MSLTLPPVGLKDPDGDWWSFRQGVYLMDGVGPDSRFGFTPDEVADLFRFGSCVRILSHDDDEDNGQVTYTLGSTWSMGGSDQVTAEFLHGLLALAPTRLCPPAWVRGALRAYSAQLQFSDPVYRGYSRQLHYQELLTLVMHDGLQINGWLFDPTLKVDYTRGSKRVVYDSYLTRADALKLLHQRFLLLPAAELL